MRETSVGLGPLSIRELRPADSIPELTALLHRAYKRLADQGFRYWASHQSEADTLKRASQGECYVGVLEGRIVSTITLRRGSSVEGTPWYREPGVHVFGQFAVEPELHGKGIGSSLLDFAEGRARGLAARELACDTAEGASRLVGMYSRRGYRLIEHVEWEGVNYRSVILSKTLR